MEEEENNPMASLENKSIDSKREMDILDALQELKTRNARIERAGKAADRNLEEVSSRRDDEGSQINRKSTAEASRKKREEEEDEAEISKVFGRAYVSGVPDIELEHDAASSTASEDGSESGHDSGTSESSTSAVASIKRKLDAIEPTPAELLSAASRSIVSKSFASGLLAASSSSVSTGAIGTMGPPKKKKGKGNDLANKLGIKLKK